MIPAFSKARRTLTSCFLEVPGSVSTPLATPAAAAVAWLDSQTKVLAVPVSSHAFELVSCGQNKVCLRTPKEITLGEAGSHWESAAVFVPSAGFETQSSFESGILNQSI